MIFPCTSLTGKYLLEVAKKLPIDSFTTKFGSSLRNFTAKLPIGIVLATSNKNFPVKDVPTWKNHVI